MKKTFNWWLLLCAMALMAACSGGDEDIDKPQNPPTPVQPIITLEDSASPDFPTDGGSNTISFSASAAWTAEVINSRADAWCSVEPTSGAAGNATITITTTANDTPDDRSASIILKAGSTQKTITVSQKQKDALTVTSDKFEVSAEGGEISIEVKTNIDFEYSISEKAQSWITSPETRALKTTNLVFNVSENEGAEKREGSITITSGNFKEEVKVYQEGTKPVITLTKSEFVVSSAGESITVEVKSNVDVSIEIPADADWITEDKSRALSTNTYHFIIAENLEYDQREAEIKFTNKANDLSETVKVTQVQKDAIVVAKNEYEFDAEGGAIDFEILTNVDVTVSIPDSISSWVTQVESRALVSQVLHFNIAPCDLSEGRSGTITLSGGNAVQQILIKQGGESASDEGDYYKSTDYTQEGKVTTLQTATKGNGINVVLMGDGYSDRQIADGTYKADMEYIYNSLFSKEPYKSFKDHFNVYYINVVSATEGYEYGNTALNGFFGDGTLVGGDDNTVFNYALNAITEVQMDEALIIVAMNSDNYAGTCYMYSSETIGDYGSGPSVSYFPKGGNEETFAQLLHHEACGHGFAKLADEYAYEEMGAAPSDYVSETKEQQETWGWWKNVDFTDDLTTIRWSKFINDTRYANEGLGAYEGGLTYWTGVWRPTERSIMLDNSGEFNAPSREAIYYRIHKLAYGADWQYDYEKFVEYDAINRKTVATTRSTKKSAGYKPLHAPIVTRKSWKDAK